MKVSCIFLLLIMAASCNFVVSDEDDKDDEFDVGGTCRVLNGAVETMNCIEFKDGAYTDPQMDTNCDNYQTDFAAEGATGNAVAYSGVLVRCGSEDRVGICRKTNYIIHYYDNEWGSGSAQSDCTSKGGAFD